MTTTTIQIDMEVRDQLRARGRMGESYNDVIRRLLNASRSVRAASTDTLAPPPTPSKPWAPLRDRE